MAAGTHLASLPVQRLPAVRGAPVLILGTRRKRRLAWDGRRGTTNRGRRTADDQELVGDRAALYVNSVCGEILETILRLRPLNTMPDQRRSKL